MKKFFIVFFLFICLIPLSIMIFFNDIEKNYENRPLAKFPQKVTTKFPKELQDYFSDNFGLRSTYISLNSILLKNFLKDSANNKVIIGKDGWLFFDQTVPDYIRSNTFSDSEIYRIYKNLKLQSDYLRDKGIDSYFTIAPNKNSIYAEFMPDRYIQNNSPSNLELMTSYMKNIDFAFIDLYDILLDAKSNNRLYHKMDTHWNNYGAYLAYVNILEKLTNEAVPIETLSFDMRKDYFGDLQKMLVPAFRVFDEQAYFKIKETFEFEDKPRSLDDITIKTINNEQDKTLVMYRDSFANALIPFISSSFNKTIYLRQFPFDYFTISTYSPDIVLIEIAERNLKELLSSLPVFPAAALSSIDLDNYIENIEDPLIDMGYMDNFIKIYGKIVSKDVFDVCIKITDGENVYFYDAFSSNSDIDDNINFMVIVNKNDFEDKEIKVEVFYTNSKNI